MLSACRMSLAVVIPPDPPPEQFLKDTSTRLSSFDFDEATMTAKVLDQRGLPDRRMYEELQGIAHAHQLISNMSVRGAPLIATVGLVGLLFDVERTNAASDDDFLQKKLAVQKTFAAPDSTGQDEFESIDKWLESKAAYLISSRPTAVNLRNELEALITAVKSTQHGGKLKTIRSHILDQYNREQEENRLLCWNGVKLITSKPPRSGDKYTILTICNTGSLATNSWGTALGIVSGLHHEKLLKVCNFLETRPYNQGSRLTASELTYANIPHCLHVDSAASFAFTTGECDAVIVGADQITRNGDTANKVGTYMLAILAHHFHVPFYVAAPAATFSARATGADIVVEHRSQEEIKLFYGKVNAPEATVCTNPVFDITPAALITGYISEAGIHRVQ